MRFIGSITALECLKDSVVFLGKNWTLWPGSWRIHASSPCHNAIALVPWILLWCLQHSAWSRYTMERGVMLKAKRKAPLERFAMLLQVAWAFNIINCLALRWTVYSFKHMTPPDWHHCHEFPWTHVAHVRLKREMTETYFKQCKYTAYTWWQELAEFSSCLLLPKDLLLDSVNPNLHKTLAQALKKALHLQGSNVIRWICIPYLLLIFWWMWQIIYPWLDQHAGRAWTTGQLKYIQACSKVHGKTDFIRTCTVDSPERPFQNSGKNHPLKHTLTWRYSSGNITSRLMLSKWSLIILMQNCMSRNILCILS